MNDTTSVSIDIDGKPITLETGVLAKQAGGSVTVRIGDTILFTAATAASSVREGIDYFPLQVEYREKFYAAGKFPGGFFKRESRPSEKETLTARFTDRPVRTMFPKNYRNEVQVISMLLSADGQNDSDAISILAASTALHVSEIPFMGPIGALRVGRVDGNFVANPTHEERERSDMDLIYAGTRDLPLMIEGGGKEISEADVVAAMRFAHALVVKQVDAQIALRSKLGLPAKVIVEEEGDSDLLVAARELAGAELGEALTVAGKLEREGRVTAVKTQLKARMQERFPEISTEQFRATFDELEIELVRRNVLEKGKRIDGRGAHDLRPLYSQVGILPRAHGSSIFQRGETQSLCTVTLGSQSDSQSMDAIAGGPREKTFFLHYNFPPYCVGETGRLGGTGRREIGHGALAERSLAEVMPKEYAYCVRLVSDIMESNGSSSMASVCGGTMALMDAGVPITSPVAGISVGLFADKNKAQLVTDILGAEDHCGDMDFKVSGTRKGITGFQVDLKIRGLAWDLVEGAFEAARNGRMQILDFIESVLPTPRAEMSPFAPRIHEMRIQADKIGALIGPGGKNIRRITALTGTHIDIEDDGTVRIFSADEESMKTAIREVSQITAEAEVGQIYNGTVSSVREFGAFVEIIAGLDGLVHISELADYRVRRVEDICKPGDQMWVKCIGIDERGRVRLSRREALKDRNEADPIPHPAGDRDDGQRDGGDREGGRRDSRSDDSRRRN